MVGTPERQGVFVVVMLVAAWSESIKRGKCHFSIYGAHPPELWRTLRGVAVFFFMGEFAKSALSETGDYRQESPVLKLLLCTDGGVLPKR